MKSAFAISMSDIHICCTSDSYLIFSIMLHVYHDNDIHSTPRVVPYSYHISNANKLLMLLSKQIQNLIIHHDNQGPLLLTCFNFNPSMDK